MASHRNESPMPPSPCVESPTPNALLRKNEQGNLPGPAGALHTQTHVTSRQQPNSCPPATSLWHEAGHMPHPPSQDRSGPNLNPPPSFPNHSHASIPHSRTPGAPYFNHDSQSTDSLPRDGSGTQSNYPYALSSFSAQAPTIHSNTDISRPASVKQSRHSSTADTLVSIAAPRSVKATLNSRSPPDEPSRTRHRFARSEKPVARSAGCCKCLIM